MFAMNLSNVKELKRLKNLKKAVKIERTFFSAFNFNELIDIDECIFEILRWLNDFFSVNETFSNAADSSLNS